MYAKPCCFSEWTGGLWLGWDLYSTVNQTCQTPPMNHVRQEEKRRRRGRFLIVVDVSLMTSSWQGLVDLPHCSWAALVPRIGPVLRSWETERRRQVRGCFSVQEGQICSGDERRSCRDTDSFGQNKKERRQAESTEWSVQGECEGAVREMWVDGRLADRRWVTGNRTWLCSSLGADFSSSFYTNFSFQPLRAGWGWSCLPISIQKKSIFNCGLMIES